MPLRTHKLPRFWLVLTVGLVASGLGAARWWQGQLPERLQQAAARGDLEACLRYSEQLAALQWLPGRAPIDQSRCRRLRAAGLWAQGQWRDALGLQRQLVQSNAATPADRTRLQQWEQELQGRALALFQQGQLEAAINLLADAGLDRLPDGSRRGDQLRELWQRNRLQLERAGALVKQNRWWEALDALNRLDHPWWKAKAKPLRQQVDTAVAGLRAKDEEHHSHGELAHTVPTAQLDALVRRHIEQGGMNEWTAFETACRQLGGRVVEAGPETACQR